MELKDSIRRVFACNSIHEEEEVTVDVALTLETLIFEELDAVTSYREKAGAMQTSDAYDRIVEIQHDEEEHVTQLCDLLRSHDESRYNEVLSEHPEIQEILESGSTEENPEEDLELTEASEDPSFTIEYREDGKTQYSNVSAKTESEALNLFNQTAKAQGRNVQGAKVVIQDTELEESIQDPSLAKKVRDHLKYNLAPGDSSVTDLRDIRILSRNDDGSLKVEVTYDVNVMIPETDAETGITTYDYETETRTNVVNVDEGKKLSIRESILRLFSESIEDDPETADQEFSSAATSINSSKLPALFKMVRFEDGSLNLDYGGGRFDNVADYLSSTYGATNLVYDPYNRSADHNNAVLAQVRKNGGADTVTCSNVLNVIKEPEARAAVIRNCKKYLKSGGTAYFTVYEGSGTGEGAPTKSGYQLNKKTDAYVDEIAQVFSSVTRKGKLIVAK